MTIGKNKKTNLSFDDMYKFWKRNEDSNSEKPALSWDPAAQAAIEQALAQAPVPGLLKGKLKNELRASAEAAARAAGRNRVTPEDVMNGMLSKLPENMRQQVEDALKEGPEGLKKLQKKLDG